MLSNGPVAIMENTPHTPPALYVGAGLFAVIVHAAVLVYKDQPISPRKAAASCVLTGCVGACAALCAVEYAHLSPAAVLTGTLVVGGIGGWSILRILTTAGERWLKYKAEAVTGDSPKEENP